MMRTRSGLSFRDVLMALALAGLIAPGGVAAAQDARPPRGAVPPGHPETGPKTPEPAVALPMEPAGRKKILDELFDKLAKAPDEREARGLANAIERVWMRSGSDTSDLLMSRALQAMQAKDNQLAQELLDRVVEIHPDWAEALNKRATARYLMEDYGGAMEDISRALKLEPRHFGALAGMGFILQKTQNEKLALRAFRKALEFNPQQEELKKIVEKLAGEVDGSDI